MTIGAMEGNVRTSAHHSAEPPADSPGGRPCSLCVGCGGVITDPYILRVQPDLEWHARCLKCVECAAELNEARTCYVRDGKTYCKTDYCRLFANRCAKCDGPFAKTEFVMRARSKAYHIDCFRCSTCARQLIPGEEFAVRNDSLFCRADFDALELLGKSPDSPNPTAGSGCDADMTGPSGANSSGNSNHGGLNNNNSSKVLNNNNIHDADIDSRDDADDDSLSPSANSETQSNCGRSSVGAGGGGVGVGIGGGLMKLSSSSKRKGSGKDSKTTRVRTVLNEKQLHTLRTCYAANPRPDALMKEQLVEMTALSPRVIRVWFQNKRCKDKKKQILIKQMEHQQQKRTLNGVSMIASSPVRHEAHIGGGGTGIQPLDVQSYSSQWGPPMHGGGSGGPDLAEHQHLHPSQPPPPPPFQQLVSAYHSLYPSDEEDDTCVSLPPDPDACMYAAAAAARQPL